MSLLVVAGPPGAGKSAVGAALANELEASVLLAGDHFFAFLGDGLLPPWLPGSDVQNTAVSRAAAAAAGVFAEAGYHVVFDGVLGPWFLPTFAQATRLTSFDYVVLLPPEEICVERVASRRGHGFTDEQATRHMHRQFVRSVADLDPRHVIGSRPVVDDLVREVVADRASGRFRYRV